MNRWFAGIVFLGACIAGATTTLVAGAQPVPPPTVSPMVSSSPTPMVTMQPVHKL
ncbi:MAG: hypothetical protein JOZ77_06095 [Candidatus Eremiobacteraeota bacterium]|nr:hypothetical protein [Candidatus Eremiobacteraeota bacterium]